jgi:hypothetical protein
MTEKISKIEEIEKTHGKDSHISLKKFRKFMRKKQIKLFQKPLCVE